MPALRASQNNPADDLETGNRMAGAIIEITRKKGACLPHELVDRGFTYDEINRLWAGAKEQADFGMRISKR